MLTKKEKKAALKHIESYRSPNPNSTLDGCVLELIVYNGDSWTDWIDLEEEESMAYEGTVVRG